MADAGRAVEPDALTSAAPLVGWRYWQFDRARSRLRSVSHRHVEWPESTALRATCAAGRHRAPAPGCNCGIYGAPDLERLRDRGLCLAPAYLVVGRVTLWGRVLSDESSHRGEYARPRSLEVVRETLPPESLDEVLGALSRYGVPLGVCLADDVLGAVSAAQLAFQAMSRRTEPAAAETRASSRVLPPRAR